MAEKILIVDDDVVLLDWMRMSLKLQGFSVFTAADGETGLTLFHQATPDLVILDVMMPGALDGLDVCHRLRQVSTVPIIFLTGRGTVNDVVQGLQQGADDYLVKPFHADELRARIDACLRRARMATRQPDVFRFGGGDLVIDRAEQKVFAHGREVSLSPLEYNLLIFMAERAGRILPAQMLFDAVWGPAAEAGVGSVKWYVWRLRQKIEAVPREPQFILTEPGKGYRFSPQ